LKSYINAIGTSVPEYKIQQCDAAEWISSALNIKGKDKKIVESLYLSTGIESRYSVIRDYLVSRDNFQFFTSTHDLEPFPTVKQRMELYQNKALPLAINAINDGIKNANLIPSKITHIIVASCTGMYAPGLDIEIIQELGLDPYTERTSIQFMGCYAAFNALKSADYICKATPDAVVLVLCVELCTIHFQKNNSRDQLVSNALFGDGAAAVIVSGEKSDGINLSMEAFKCMIAPNSKKEMAWHISNTGFEMKLSSYVPKVIKSGIKDLAGKLLRETGFDKNIDYYAIHPGGRKILEVCEEELGLNHEDNCHAYNTLKNYGNMSSPTVLFVIKSHMDNLMPQDAGKKMLSFAFGPGLTMESMLLEVV
jgi:alpha-pyrone synthase